MIEHPADRLARMFNMGKYGENMAREILRDYREILAEWLETDDHQTAADAIREFGEYEDADPHDVA